MNIQEEDMKVKYQCRLCEKKYNYRSSWRKHYIRKHDHTFGKKRDEISEDMN